MRPDPGHLPALPPIQWGTLLAPPPGSPSQDLGGKECVHWGVWYPNSKGALGLAKLEAFILVRKAGTLSPATLQIGVPHPPPSPGPGLPLAFPFLWVLTAKPSALRMPWRCWGVGVCPRSHLVSTWLQ